MGHGNLYFSVFNCHPTPDCGSWIFITHCLIDYHHGTGVTMVFEYLPALEIICVKGEPADVLLEIVAGDHGESSPNPANEYQLDEWCVGGHNGWSIS